MYVFVHASVSVCPLMTPPLHSSKDTSVKFVSPLIVLPVDPAVVAPPLQTQLHHGCSVVVSNAVTNGNPVHGQSNNEAPGGYVRGHV